jgi:biotin carboxylase
MVTGVDSIKAQILLAAGHALSMRQQDVVLNGSFTPSLGSRGHVSTTFLKRVLAA